MPAAEFIYRRNPHLCILLKVFTFIWINNITQITCNRYSAS